MVNSVEQELVLDFFRANYNQCRLFDCFVVRIKGETHKIKKELLDFCMEWNQSSIGGDDNYIKISLRDNSRGSRAIYLNDLVSANTQSPL